MRAEGLTRRQALALAGAATLLPGLKPFAWAEGQSGLHGLSVFGEFKYPPGFAHFDYINPAAPKGGIMRFQPPNWNYNHSTETFNTLNGYVQRGDAPPRVGLMFDSLMSAAADEPAAVYGLLAESVAVSEDGNSYAFTLRPEARFHDGSPVTAEDVAWSLTTLKEKGHASIYQSLTEMAGAEATDARTVTVRLTGGQNRETILVISQMPVFSKAFYADREFDAATMTPPLGSGPYRMGAVNAGVSVEYERVPDYWGRDLPVNVGFWNFDRIRIDFFREREVAFEAFKKGLITCREEFTSATWATQYNFPAFNDGRVKKSEFPAEARPDLQGWYFNTRRAKFSDPRTRQAIALVFDFEWTNRNVFYGLYTRQVSFFQKSDFVAEGLPGPEELALLEPFRDELDPAVFGEAYVPPVADGSGRDRRLFRQASDLLAAAGWRLDGGRLVDADGTQLAIEFLIEAEVFQRVLVPYAESLKLLGIDATVRQVDPSQYQARQTEFDYDVIGVRFSLSATPLDSPQQFFSSKAAEIDGSYNFAGVKLAAVDALLARVPEVDSRAELIPLLKSIDRVLRAYHYWVPNWYSSSHRIGHWDVFSWPERKPEYGFPVEAMWWFDLEKAVAIGMAD